MKKIILSLVTLFNVSTLTAEDNIKKVGDIFQMLIPATAYATTLYVDDVEGQHQFYKSYATTMGATFILKYTVNEKRPDSSSTDSFPSGHTSRAFAGASFIHMRYGFEYAWPAYLGAIFTGYSRLEARAHHPIDVIAGALLGTISSFYFASSYKKITFTANLENDYKGLTLNYKF